MSRPIEPGDHVIISLGNNWDNYIIIKIDLPLIYIYPEKTPSIRNALNYVNGHWKVKHAEHVNYNIVFSAKPAPPEITIVSPEITISAQSMGNTRADLFRTPQGRFQYEGMIRRELDKIVAPNGYQCLDAKVGEHSLLDHFNLTNKMGQGSFGTVYSACTPLERPGQCVQDPYIFAVKAANSNKTSVKTKPENRFKTVIWAENYLMEQLRPLILDQRRGQAFPILYKTYPCINGCRPAESSKRGLVSCIVTLMELAEGDLNSWAKTVVEGSFNKTPGFAGHGAGLSPSGGSLLSGSIQDDYDNALFQVMAGIAAFQDVNVQVYHNDIKKQNILWYRVQPGGVWKYIIGGNTYYLPNRGYVMIIGDYGVSETFSQNIEFKIKRCKDPAHTSRGYKGIIRDERAGISYPLLFDKNQELSNRYFAPNSMSIMIVNQDETPEEVRSNVSKITRNHIFMYRSYDRRLSIGTIQYKNDVGKIPPASCVKYDTMTNRERDIIGNIGICSNEILNRTDIYPNIQYINDTQDAIRLFTGGKRMDQPDNHLPIQGAPDNWLMTLSDYISGDRTRNDKSLYNRKMFAEDFISHYFNGKYVHQGNEAILAEFSCRL
jgi:hypothetical protein